MNDLGKALLNKVDHIIEIWVDEVRRDMEIESNRGMTYEAVHNGLPDVLASVAKLLTPAFSETKEQVLEEEALAHGKVRAEQGFDIAEVVREYRTLRNILLTELESDLRTGTVEEAIRAIRKIDAVLDDAVMVSMECYVNRRMVSLGKMHAQLLLTNQELTRLVQAHKDNVSHLAHELKNPLNSIISFSSILLRKQQKQLAETTDEPMEMQQVERILTNGQQLLRLINNTLETSRSESQQLTLTMEPVAVPELIKSVVEALEPSISDKPVTLSWNCQQAPDYAMIDGLRLQQILTNLVSNAIRYTDEGSVEVICYTQGDDLWAIAVSDTGRGLSVEHQSKIFEPYFRVGSSEDYLPESSGLGLTIVNKMVQLLGGTIEV